MEELQNHVAYVSKRELATGGRTQGRSYLQGVEEEGLLVSRANAVPQRKGGAGRGGRWYKRVPKSGTLKAKQ